MMHAPLRIIYAGTPEFAVPSLAARIAAGHRVAAVYTQPDRPAGRGRKLTASPVKALALAHGIPVYQPVNFRSEEALAELEAIGCDLMIVAAYGLILPRRVLAAPRIGCINVHASLLPRWRGAAPIQRALMAGDAETGITIMGMEAGLDTGPMFLKRATSIAPDDTGGTLHDRLATLGAEALMAALPGIAEGSLQPEPQDAALANYAAKLAKEEAAIDWTRPAVELDRQIRAFNPWPVAQTALQGETLRLWHSCIAMDTPAGEAPPGRVIAAGKAGIDVATGAGVLRLLQLQLPGKKPQTAREFLNAHSMDDLTLG